MVQERGRPRLAPEPDQRGGPQESIARQHLQRHATAQALLHRLVDDPHAPAADLPEDPVVAQPLGHRPAAPRPILDGPLVRVGIAADPLHHHQRGEQLADLAGQVRVAVGIFAERRPFAPPVSLGEFVRQVVEQVRSGLRLSHGQGSSQSPPRPLRMSLSRRNAARSHPGRLLLDPEHAGRLDGRKLLEMTERQHLAVERIHGVQGLLEPELQLEAGRLLARPGEVAQQTGPPSPWWWSRTDRAVDRTSRRGSRIRVPRWWRCSSRSLLPTMPLNQRKKGPRADGRKPPGPARPRDRRPGGRPKHRRAPGVVDRGGRPPSGAADSGLVPPGPPSSRRRPPPRAARGRRFRPFPPASRSPRFPIPPRVDRESPAKTDGLPAPSRSSSPSSTRTSTLPQDQLLSRAPNSLSAHTVPAATSRYHPRPADGPAVADHLRSAIVSDHPP